ncbi:lasso peptide biosynthesis B2 protein [Paenarthrobacter sp. NPDC089675]|uniref:lasso peptide biosynthesis B2 protein n=1 Tax=Paenarthrobacter sp. NPDC089675 TaxID=3364376 RepID=UPI0037FF0A8A
MSLPLAPQRAVKPQGMVLLRTRVVTSIAWTMTLMPPSLLQSFLQFVAHKTRPSTSSEARRIRAAVCAVSERCAGEGCLQRSIASFILCRLEGHSPSWKTGYRLEPFAAHAWIEVDGVPIDEPPSVGSFVPVLSVQQPESVA